MPKSDRKINPKISEFENAKTMEICKNCGDLKSFGTNDCTCGLTYEQDEGKYTKYKLSSDMSL